MHIWQLVEPSLPMWLKEDRPGGRFLFSFLLGTDNTNPLLQEYLHSQYIQIFEMTIVKEHFAQALQTEPPSPEYYTLVTGWRQ